MCVVIDTELRFSELMNLGIEWFCDKYSTFFRWANPAYIQIISAFGRFTKYIFTDERTSGRSDHCSPESQPKQSLSGPGPGSAAPTVFRPAMVKEMKDRSVLNKG